MINDAHIFMEALYDVCYRLGVTSEGVIPITSVTVSNQLFQEIVDESFNLLKHKPVRLQAHSAGTIIFEMNDQAILIRQDQQFPA